MTGEQTVGLPSRCSVVVRSDGARRDDRVPVIQHLRGVAALAVCFFHFTNGRPGFLHTDDPLRGLGSFGWLGVEAFFVISGFVIPYSLHQRSYRLRGSGAFLVRRLKRLEPPYFACIALVVGLQLLSASWPGFRGEAWPWGISQLVAHVAYLNAILGYGWVNPVFWTLAIEFQFYLFMALIFPLLVADRNSVRVAAVMAIAAAGVLGVENNALLPHWLPLFAIGMATFQVFVGHVTRWQFPFLIISIAGIAFVSVGRSETFVGVFTAAAILLGGHRSLPQAFAPLAWAGLISYSLYLVHVPVGGRCINLATRLPDGVGYRYGAILVAFAVSMGAAALFWRIVERPSQRWASARKQNHAGFAGAAAETEALGKTAILSACRFAPQSRDLICADE